MGDLNYRVAMGASQARQLLLPTPLDAHDFGGAASAGGAEEGGGEGEKLRTGTCVHRASGEGEDRILCEGPIEWRARQALLRCDQLQAAGSAPRRCGFEEGAIGFAPTYKLAVVSRSLRRCQVAPLALPYVISEEHVPSWTDRVLHKHRPSRVALALTSYAAVFHPNFGDSDHRPVRATFRLRADLAPPLPAPRARHVLHARAEVRRSACAALRRRLARSAPHRLLCGRLPLTCESLAVLVAAMLPLLLPRLLAGSAAAPPPHDDGPPAAATASPAVAAAGALVGATLLAPLLLVLAVGPSAAVAVRPPEDAQARPLAAARRKQRGAGRETTPAHARLVPGQGSEPPDGAPSPMQSAVEDGEEGY